MRRRSRSGSRRAAEILGLTPYLDRYPRQLSGGQRQRVAMGRAIVREPQVFLFDEPLSNLDAKLRVQMRTEIKQLHQRLKTTTIFVTHDQIEAMTMADRIVVMQNGVIEQIGTPLELYDSPKNLFVAGFIGSPAMNFVKGAVHRNGALTVASGDIRLPVPDGHALPEGQEVVFGVRPEHLELADEGIPAEVGVIEPTGSETMVFMKVGCAATSSRCSASGTTSGPGRRSGSGPTPSTCISSTAGPASGWRADQTGGTTQC